MIQAILAYILIFVTIFLCSVSISFTALKSKIDTPKNSKFRMLQQKRIVNALLKNYNQIAFSQDSLRRELIYKKLELQNQLLTTDSLLDEMNLNEEKLNKSNSLIIKNTKILSNALK